MKLNAHLSHLTLVGQGTSGIKEDLTVSRRYADLNVVIHPMEFLLLLCLTGPAKLYNSIKVESCM